MECFGMKTTGMGFTKFKVVLEPHQPIYFPGQQVTGYVEIVAEAEVACRGIKATVKGKCNVKWTERRGKTTHHYTAEEVYIRQAVRLWKGSEFDHTMPRGSYRLPFSFLLPLAIPSSFESDFGAVRYRVKAEADRPWSLDQCTKVMFSVNYIYDLNCDRYSMVPLKLEKEKTVCCCCCAAGPICLDMVAARSGYVPGESIVVYGEVANHSNSTIKYSEVKIIQRITYITPRKNKQVERTVQRMYRPSIPAGQRDRWEGVSLPIPPLPATHLKHCNIITIDYYFQLAAKLGTCKAAKVSNVLIIGAVPLRGTYSSSVSSADRVQPGGTVLANSIMPDIPPRTSSLPRNQAPPPVPLHQHNPDDPPPYTLTMLPDNYQDVPPPSYAACMFGGAGRGRGDWVADSDDDEGGFAPSYVSYRTPHVAQ